jgi:hypothetical protein
VKIIKQAVIFLQGFSARFQTFSRTIRPALQAVRHTWRASASNGAPANGMGAPKAMTATAHKLARIIYHMITTQQEYDATVWRTAGSHSVDCE